MTVRLVTGLNSRGINTKRLSNLEFEAEGHKYRYKGRVTKLSTTSFIKEFFSVFDSYAIINNFMSKPGSKSEVKYRGMTPDEIDKQWKDNGDIASGKGTILHEMVEFA